MGVSPSRFEFVLVESTSWVMIDDTYVERRKDRLK